MRSTRLVALAIAGSLAAGIAAASDAADAADAVRAAETAFAKAFADRDSAKFFSFVADDASFLSPTKVLGGKVQVVQGWSRFFQSAKAPFTWRPERVVVDGDGNLGLSTGPVFDETGKQTGNFTSMWRRQKDGTWKVVFDGPGAPVCPPPPPGAK